MRQNEHREKEHGKIRHENEFVLVDRRAFLVAVKKIGINLVTEQFEDICHNHQRQEQANVCDKRPFRNSTRSEGATKHDQSCCNGNQVKSNHEDGTSVLYDFAFTLQKRKMTLGEQSPEDECQFPAEGNECHRENEQQQTEYQRNPTVRTNDRIPLELSYRKPMPREHGTNRRINKQNDYGLFD
jgi:hypothetical protein